MNLVKKAAKELNITYKELGDMIGLSESSIKRLAVSKEVNLQVLKSLEMLLKIKDLEEELADFRILKKILKKQLLNIL